jgi:DNA-binding Xre family transcriptional regulator
MPITVDIDVMLAQRKMSGGELAERVGITPPTWPRWEGPGAGRRAR